MKKRIDSMDSSHRENSKGSLVKTGRFKGF